MLPVKPNEPNHTTRIVSLDDKWRVENGRVLMSGTQALARVLLAQAALDRRDGLRTAGYVTGYRGSPLGSVDTTLWSIAKHLDEAAIVFQPGLNEDLAATAVHGTQQLDAVPQPKYAAVFAAWYGKGPGVDRSGDAFKHGNFAGTHPHGGVLLFYGDDHAGKSSTVAHHSEQAVAASLIPSLYPSTVQEVVEYGLLGFALSRYSGSWVGIKCVNEVAEQTATVDMNLAGWRTSLPAAGAPRPPGFHARQGVFNPLGDEQIVVEHRLPAVHAFVRANGIDRTVLSAPRRALGLITAGKSYGDVKSALRCIGLDEARAAALGISIYKVGCIWPLEPTGLAAFAEGHETLFVIEEKKSFVELQAAAVLINRPQRPRLIGKLDEDGNPLLSATLPLEIHGIARAILARLERLRLLDADLAARRDELDAALVPAETTSPKRSPYFCSGCPHNRSTQIPDGSFSMTGIGCHTMANFARPTQALLPAQMGGEGANWLGLAPFTGTAHMFQNMGDGTYYHSGLLAIRAAVAAKVNVTFKILYNDAVAMTGGQPVDGPVSVAAIARQVQAEGVAEVVLLSDDPDRHRASRLPSGVTIGHRDELDAVQRRLRLTAGCTILIYEQTCAAEKRRRRKRGTYPNQPKRLFIAKAVCEGCGDCSVQSTCVSITPVDTEFGRKRSIDQSSCNKDYSCAAGFCPSFVTVYGAEPRKPAAVAMDDGVFAALPAPSRAALGDSSFNLMIAGVGGTGVITVGALIGMAAHMDGMAASLFDMTGLSQKNGAVYTHVRIASDPSHLHSQRLGRGEADVLLAFDLIAALSPESADTLNAARTRAIANADVAPTVAFQFDRDAGADPGGLLERLRRAAPAGNVAVPASAIALAMLGDTIGANLFMLGLAVQRGLMPVSAASLEAAVALNGVAVDFNIRAFRLGRWFAVDPQQVIAAAGLGAAARSTPLSLEETIAHRMRHLTEYQGLKLAGMYRDMVERVAQIEARQAPGRQALALTVARNYCKVLAYKDEYEVARLLTSAELRRDLERNFADGARLAFNLAPPAMTAKPAGGRPAKREFGAWILPLLGVLKRGRVLRGTWFDVFGRTAERRMERALIEEYTALILRVLPSLTVDNHAEAVCLLTMIDEVRGYGPVKEAAVGAYRRRIAAAERAFQDHARAAAPASTDASAVAAAG